MKKATGEKLLSILPADRIRSRYIDLVSYASDAGFYFLMPKAVVKPVSEEEIVALFRFSHEEKVPLVFRGGGTSLSGQSITDGILVDLSQYWNKLQTEQGGATVRVQPGITGAMVNAYLKKYSRKIGPDPSSIGSAMMGGILSNNSSGMCCGVVANAYHTTKFIRFILPNGKTFSTEEQKDYERFSEECPDIFASLREIKAHILADESLSSRIRKKYITKNTVGYSLNSFIDHEHPLDILAHLLIGGEGTLAFIAEAVMNTIPDKKFKSTALLYFSDIYAACQAIVPLRDAGAEAVELMDRASLRSIELFAGMPAVVKTLPDTASALLIEFQDDDQLRLAESVNRFLAETGSLSLLYAPQFTFDTEEQAFLWRVRKGLFPAVGAVRVSGTTVILEDIAVPVEHLGDAIVDLQKLFSQFGYNNAIIFGHAKDGNLHFVITQNLNAKQEVDRYDRFLRAVVELVVEKYDGALKAEHGTGRNIAPFVETEWGADAYRIMLQLKQCIDPDNLLNPGVIINADPSGHIRNLKELYSVEAEVDKCIECGYCEHKCPSRDITMTPRRRIVARRELKRLQLSGDKKSYALLAGEYQYDGLDTCAVDGLCATACPVDINTGDLVKRLRRENHSALQNGVATWIAKHFSSTEAIVRTALSAGATINRVFGNKAMMRLTRFVRKIVPGFPLWSEYLTKPPRKLSKGTVSRAVPGNPVPDESVVYFPSCISRVMGSGVDGKKNVMETFLSVAEKAGVGVRVLPALKGSCCGQIFSSKGFYNAYAYTANRIVDELWRASEEGRIPIVIDVSSCAYTLHHLSPALTPENRSRFQNMTVLDSVSWLHDMVIGKKLRVEPKKRIVLHPVCSLEKMHTQQKFIAVARMLADEVTVPVHTGCCGMAGDRGFLFPELTASATRQEALEVQTTLYDGYYSSTKTCELAMSEAVRKNYESILYLADEAMT